MTKVKICGITNIDDAKAAAGFGADQIGLNFYPPSPRCLTVEQARRITDAIGRLTEFVGVFVNESVTAVVDAVRFAGLDAVQLHGDEGADFIAELRNRITLPVIKAVRVTAGFEPAERDAFGADAILLDSFSADQKGGTGKTFDWQLAERLSGVFPALYLAGGLTPENVQEAVAMVRPFAVDTCSGVESSPGKKDREKVRLFIERAKQND